MSQNGASGLTSPVQTCNAGRLPACRGTQKGEKFRLRRASPEAGTAPALHSARVTVLSSRILVVSAHDDASLDAVRALDAAGAEVFVAAESRFDPALHEVPASHRKLVPPADEPELPVVLARWARSRSMDVLLPMDPRLIRALSVARAELRALGITAIVPSSGAAQVFGDRFSLVARAGDAVPLPDTEMVAPEDAWPTDLTPAWVTPRDPSATGALTLDEHEGRAHAAGRAALVQHFIPGVAFDVAIVGDASGSVAEAVVVERPAGRAGPIIVATNHEAAALGVAVYAHLDLRFAATVRMRRDAEGALRVMGVSPGFGGHATLAAQAGVDIADAMLCTLRGGTWIARDVEAPVTAVRSTGYRRIDAGASASARPRRPVRRTRASTTTMH